MALVIDISKIKFLTWNVIRHSVTERSVLVSPADVTVEEATGNHYLPGKHSFYLQLRRDSSVRGKVVCLQLAMWELHKKTLPHAVEVNTL